MTSSFVESVLNISVFSQVDLRGHLGPLIKNELPIRLLPTFLHETTHHWCFLSPLGNALALLRLRSFRKATKLRSQSNHDEYVELLDDWMKEQALVEILRPISEGLACFMEFDCVPGDRDVTAQPLNFTMFKFGGKLDLNNLKDRDFSIHSHLFEMRQSEILFRRRENVLASRFNTVHGGHLAGYLTVKNLWILAKKQSELAHDSELFISFLRSYIYDDYGFVSTLLDENSNEIESVNQLIIYFTQRIQSLFVRDLDDMLRKFESGINESSIIIEKENGDKFVHTNFQGIETEPCLIQLGRDRLELLIDQLNVSDSDYIQSYNKMDKEPWQFIEKAMLLHDRDRMKSREYLCIGSLDATVKVTKYGKAVVTVLDDLNNEIPLFSGPTLPEIVPNIGEGIVEYYFLPLERQSAMAVFQDRKCILVNFLGTVTEKGKASFIDVISNRSHNLKMISESEENLSKVIKESLLSVYQDKLKDELPKSINNLYLTISTAFVSKDKYKEISLLLEKEDLFGVLLQDADFIKGLSILGAITTVEKSIDNVREILKRYDIDLSQLIKKSTEIRSKNDFDTILHTEQVITALI